MNVYIVFELLIIAFGLLSQFVNGHREPVTIVNRYGSIRYKNQYSIFYWILFVIFVFVTGFRYFNGSDYGAYVRLIFTKEEVFESIKTFEEPLEKIIVFISRSIYDDGIFVMFVFSLITLSLVFYGIKKYDQDNITMMSLMYVLIGGWLFALGGIRQALAVSIIFAFFEPNRKNNYIRNIIVVCAIAFLAHRSALMMIPILLLSKRKFDYKQIILLIVAAIILPLIFNGGYDFMEVDFEIMGEIEKEYFNHAINPIRIVVAIAPVLLIFLTEDKKLFISNNKVVFNMGVLNAFLTLTTYQSAYLNRMVQYVTIYLSAYIPMVLRNLRKEYRMLVTILVVVLYTIYWLYEIDNTGNLSPFRWCFEHFGEF